MYFQEIPESTANQGFTEWTAWTVVVLLLFLFAFYDMGRRFKQKKFIKGYKNFDDFSTISDEKRKKGGKRYIGEFKSQFYNKIKRIWEIRFRKGTKYFNAQSTDPMAEYEEVHFDDEYYIVTKALNIVLSKKPLKESEYYERELGYSLQAWFYKGISFCMNLEAHSFFFSIIIFGTISAALFFNQIGGWSLIAGSIFGVIMSIINHIIHDHTKYGKNLLAPKKELVTEEYFLSPLESPIKKVNIYKVKGFERIESSTIDNAKKLDKAPLKGRKKIEGITEEGNKRKLKIPNHVERRDLRDDEKDTDYIIVEGWDELVKMILNPHVEIEEYELISQKKVHKTPEEIRDLTHDYLERNQEFTDRIFDLLKKNAELRRYNKSLFNQMNTIQETITKEMKELGDSMIITQKGIRKNLRIYIEEVYGDFIGEDIEEVIERVIRRIRMEEKNTIIEKYCATLEQYIEAHQKVIAKLEEQYGVGVTSIFEKLKLPIIKEEGAKTSD